MSFADDETEDDNSLMEDAAEKIEELDEPEIVSTSDEDEE